MAYGDGEARNKLEKHVLILEQNVRNIKTFDNSLSTCRACSSLVEISKDEGIKQGEEKSNYELFKKKSTEMLKGRRKENLQTQFTFKWRCLVGLRDVGVCSCFRFERSVPFNKQGRNENERVENFLTKALSGIIKSLYKSYYDRLLENVTVMFCLLQKPS
ncbi:CLUMA_CG019317, isoform A [Clunio marinus]|uniref:CLUMA_CG019317, isoform A n=1 Tax=Clunio marinus TaxID=568069 RepID=A0A1J1J1G6_9DIPT|nr:CLUMA_CG019317, isoform A [Clunio marinus]